MHVGANIDYALRAMLELAAAPSTGFVPASQLARVQGVPSKFLVSILNDLSRSGIVHGRRGYEGGFRLERPPEAISVADIMRAVDGPLSSVRGEAPEDLVYRGAACGMRDLWIAMRASVRAVAEQVTLADLLAQQLPPSVERLAHDPDAQTRRLLMPLAVH